MRGVSRGLTLVSLLLALLTGCGVAVYAQAPLPTTTVADTVYNASGAPASGTVLVSWAAFTAASGASIPAGSTSATIGANGSLSISLAPNAGATPIGSYYTATFHLSDGTTSRQYWVVPQTVTGGGAAKLSAIQNSVLPTSVAMQTVSKAYVDSAIAAAVAGAPQDTTSPYVLITGDTMTGPLVLPGDPVSPLQAADKNYVDENVTPIAAGLSGKVALLPSATQTVTQPSGTQLDVNLLNGEIYANEYVNAGNDGIQNAANTADCSKGCSIVVPPTYTGIDTGISASLPNATAVVDQRGGAVTRTTSNPTPLGTTSLLSETVTQEATISAPQLQVVHPGAVGVNEYAMDLTTDALTGGSNLFPGNIETVPYFKNTYGVQQLVGNYNTQGQHVQFGNAVNCYGVGDCLAGSQFIVSSGGYRDNADEGAHPFDLQITEDTHVFTGTCSTGCATGATSLHVNATSGPGTQGDGRFLIDTASSKTITAGQLTGGQFVVNGAVLQFGQASFTGTNFPVSTFLITSQAATSQPANMAPGTVTLPIATTGVPSGYATSTAALPATSGIACVADGGGGGSDTPNYEMAPYTVVDASHLSLTLNKVHEQYATVTVGGLCGYGIEQTVDTRNGIRQLWPVIGSLSSTSLFYAESGSALIGVHGAGNTSGYLNQSLSIASISRTNNVATVTITGSPLADLTGLTMTVAGVSDSSYNGSFVVSMTGSNTFTYTNNGANSTSSGGALSYVTGGYVLYPMAEVLSVYNASNRQVDGTFTLAPNTVAWAAGDTVEEPHYYKQQTYADQEFVTQYVPRPQQNVSAGKVYQGLMGAGARGWQISNTTPTNLYFGNGGTYTVPDDAHLVTGAWANDFEVDAGTNAVLRVHCNYLSCTRWDSTYKLLDMDSSVGEDYLYFAPASHTATWQLGGIDYSFSPSAFTAPTINVGTLNATTIHGSVNASSITAGTLNVAQLPVFQASGSAHAGGAVPDPGPTAGSTRFLREDGTWTAPVGGSAAQNVKAYGATGNGTTDDTAAVAACIAAASGNACYFPAGTYLVSPTLTINVPVLIKGETRSGSVLKFHGASASPFVSVTSSNVGFEDITIDATGQSGGGAGISFASGLSNATFERVIVKNAYQDCVTMLGTSAVTVDSSTFAGCGNIQFDVSFIGLSNVTADGIQITNSVFDDTGAVATPFVALYVGHDGTTGDLLKNVVLANNIVRFTGLGATETDGIVTDGAASSHLVVSNWAATGNTVIETGASTSGNGVEIESVTNFAYTGGSVCGTNNGILVEDAGPADTSGVVSGVDVSCAQNIGIDVTATPVTVSGNTVTMTGTYGINDSAGSNLLDGNTVKGAQTGIYTTASSTRASNNLIVGATYAMSSYSASTLSNLVFQNNTIRNANYGVLWFGSSYANMLAQGNTFSGVSTHYNSPPASGVIISDPAISSLEAASVTAASTIAPASALFHLTGTTTVNAMTPLPGMTTTAGANGSGGFVDFIADAATPFAAGTSVGSFKAAFTTAAGTPYHCAFTAFDGALVLQIKTIWEEAAGVRACRFFPAWGRAVAEKRKVRTKKHEQQQNEIDIFNERTQGIHGPQGILQLAEDYIVVRNRGGQKGALIANAAQRQFELRRGRQNIVLKARQMGITTWVAARFFLRTIMVPGTITLQVAHTRSAAESIFRMVHRMWSELPQGLREGPLKRSRANVGQMVFPEIDSEFRIASACDEGVGRGLTVQNLHCSEVSRWPRDAAEILAGLRAALAPGGELVLESTPNGAYGAFYDEWRAGTDEPGSDAAGNDAALVRHFLPWWLETAYVGPEVRPETLSEDECRLIATHELTRSQIGFRRSLERSYGALRSQEFAEDAETCFRASGLCCFDLDAIEQRLLELGDPLAERRIGALHVWLPPQAGHEYLIAVDTAGGGAEGDFAAAQVIDLNTGLQCAELQQRLRPAELAHAAAELAREYNGATVVVERNNHGSAVLAYLDTRERYERVWRERGEAGWLTTSANKPEMIARLGTLLEKEPQRFLSRRLLSECRSYVQTERGSGAAQGAHDDLVMAMAIGQAVRASMLQGARRGSGARWS